MMHESNLRFGGIHSLRREEGESEDRYDSSIVFTFFFFPKVEIT